MFRWLIERPTTLYGFLSGMFMSVATTALSNFALAANAPTNLPRLIKSAILAFAAATLWFLLGEYESALKRRVEENQEGATGTKAEAYKKAVDVVGEDVGGRLFIILIAAIICSVFWPFI